jgi:hypothetical protein
MKDMVRDTVPKMPFKFMAVLLQFCLVLRKDMRAIRGT